MLSFPRKGPSKFLAVVASVGLFGCLEPPAELPTSTVQTTDVSPTEDASIDEVGGRPPVDLERDAADISEVRDTGPSGPRFVGVSAGDSFACAWTDEGRTMCWGQNWRRQANPDSPIDPSPPTWVLGEWSFEAIDAGPARSCGLTGDDRVVCWGNNSGNATPVLFDTTDISVPPTERDLTDSTLQSLTSVALGWDVNCVTTPEQALCWGDNADRLIDSSNTDGGFLEPTAWRNVTRISPGADHACSLSGTGRVTCWGKNHSYKVDPSAFGVNGAFTSPTTVDGGANYAAVTTGISHTCGLLTSGGVRCWGRGSDYRLGVEGFPKKEEMPVDVPGLPEVVDLDAYHDTCALTTDGRLWCWGQFQEPPGPSLTDPPDGSEFESVSVGNQFVCATSATGVWCWGWNSQGRAGQFEDDVALDVTLDEPTLVPAPPLP